MLIIPKLHRRPLFTVFTICLAHPLYDKYNRYIIFRKLDAQARACARRIDHRLLLL